jgi:hypothetical protein
MTNAALNAELERAVFAEPAEDARVKDLCVAASMRVALRMQAASAAKAAA